MKHDTRSGPARPALATASLALALGCLSASSHLSAQQPAQSPPAAPAVVPLVPAPAWRPLAFKDVTVIDVTDGRLLPAQTVVVAENRVQAVGPTGKVRVPKDAQVVDAQGKYMVPGFWDMHAHTEQVPAEAAIQVAEYRKAYPLYVANGVTGIREMAQRFPGGADSFRVWQREVMDGKRIGPRAVGPSADLTYKVKIGTPDDARRVIDSLKAAGDAFVKYHDSHGNRDLFFAVLREARRAGLPVVGHVPRAVKVAEALDSGMRSVEHINEHHDCAPVPVDSADVEEKCGAMARAYIRNGAWLVPTFAIFYYWGASEEAVEDSRMFMHQMYRLGIRRFLAGTDCEPHFLKKRLGLDKICHRGFSVLQEVIALKDAGLTPLEALQSATLHPAQFFEATDSLGTIAPGKLADLVLLDADPLVNIRNILKIRAVIANGRYFDRSTLDAMDPRGIKLAALYAEGQPDITDEPPSDEDAAVAPGD
jgi:imidazolonepropionase-like amidohydrolase